MFAFWAVVSTWPLSGHPARVLPDSADAVVFAWAVSWVAHQLGHDPGHLFQANAFHPDPAALAYGEPMVAQGVLAAPLWALTGNDAVTYNLVYVLTLALSAGAMFLLAREVVGGTAPAAIAGLIFAFTTANYDSAARLQIVSSQWTPLTLFFLVRTLRRGRLRDGLACGGCFALQALSCKYYQLYLATLLAVTLPFFVRGVPALPLARRPWRALAAGALLVVVVLLPFDLVQYRHLRRIESTRERRQAATLASYAHAMPGNWLHGARFGLAGTVYDDRYFPGVLPPLLAAAGLALGVPAVRRRLTLQAPSSSRGLALPFFVLGAAAFLFSFGEALPLAGGVPGPFRLLDAYVPGYAETRVPSRFIMFVRLVTALFAALALSTALGSLPNRVRAARRAAFVMLAVLLPFEHLSAPLPAWPVSSGERVPEVYRWLRNLGDEAGPVLEFPPHPVRLRRWESFWQHFSTVHWLPLVNGFSAYYPVHYDFVYDELLELPSERSLAVLEELGARYVVFHPKPPGTLEGDRAVRRFENRIGGFADRLVLVRTFGDGAVAYPDPIQVLGGERVYGLVRKAVSRERAGCTERGSPWPRNGWRCESDPEGGCARAIDGDAATAFGTGPTQAEGQFLRVLFGRPLTVSRVALVTGKLSQYYPRTPQLRMLRGGQWEPLRHSFDPILALRQMLDCPDRAALEFKFAATIAEGVEVRLGPAAHRFNPWLLPELEVYP